MLLILIVLNEGSLWSACGLHTSWNWTMGCVLGLDVSGDVTKSGVLIDLLTIGPDILSGGKFGPEASIITSAVLIAGIIFILIKKKTE